MRKSFFVMLFLLTATALFAYTGPVIRFPEYCDHQGMSERLLMLRQMFGEAKTRDQQDLVFSYILACQDKRRNDLVMDIALQDLKGAGIYGKSLSVFGHIREQAISNVMLSGDARYLYGYAYILKFDTSVDARRLAAMALGKIKTKESVNLITYFLNFLYNPKPFNPDNPKMVQEDRVAEELVKALGDIGSPSGIPILLQIVNMQNHLQRTIDQAWDSLSRLRIKSDAYKYFILSLKDSLDQRSEQVSPDQQAQVEKTVETLVKFIRENFERYQYTEDDVETVRGTLKEEGASQ